MKDISDSKFDSICVTAAILTAILSMLIWGSINTISSSHLAELCVQNPSVASTLKVCK